MNGKIDEVCYYNSLCGGSYAKTKECSINVVEKLFGDSPPECWIKSKKKDDLSDVIIQAFAYCDKLV